MDIQDKTYSDAIEAVLMANNYIASLQTIYKEISRYRKLTGKIPFATIQERVQRDKRFTRIEKGVYALTSFLDKLPRKFLQPKTQKEKSDRVHYRMQGMLIEIGNCLKFSTYCANKKGNFAGRPLESYQTISNVPAFTYEHIVNRARNVDVIWFNEEGFPHQFYEVDTSASFQRSLLKFVDLRHFYTEFKIVSDHNNKASFSGEIGRNTYREIKNRVKFLSYATVENMYESSLQQFVASKTFFNDENM